VTRTIIEIAAGADQAQGGMLVTLEDDLTGGPTEQTVRFAFDGTGYEIDLNAKNAAAFSKQLAPYLEHARRAGRA
jgi:nucleoid-associated protein Lsr2